MLLAWRTVIGSLSCEPLAVAFYFSEIRAAWMKSLRKGAYWTCQVCGDPQHPNITSRLATLHSHIDLPLHSCPVREKGPTRSACPGRYSHPHSVACLSAHARATASRHRVQRFHMSGLCEHALHLPWKQLLHRSIRSLAVEYKNSVRNQIKLLLSMECVPYL